MSTSSSNPHGEPPPTHSTAATAASSIDENSSSNRERAHSNYDFIAISQWSGPQQDPFSVFDDFNDADFNDADFNDADFNDADLDAFRFTPSPPPPPPSFLDSLLNPISPGQDIFGYRIQN